MSTLQLDGNKMLHHLDKVNAWDRGELIAPVYIAFSPTSYCNHHCVFCVYHYKEFKPIFFPLAKFQELTSEWANLGVRSLFFAGDGDPLVHKQCDEMVAAAKANGIDVALNTNGRLLSDKNISVFVRDLSFIRVSINAGTAASYAHIHGTKEQDFNIVIENLKSLVKEKKKQQSKMTIGVQCLLLSKNLDEIKTLALLVKEIGVDYLSIKPYLKHPEIEFDDAILNLDEALEDLSFFQKTINDSNFSFVLRKTLFEQKAPRGYKKCLATPFMIEIDALGDIYSCGPYIGNADHCLGNVLKTSFNEAWTSDKAIQARAHIENCVNVSACMPSCRPDSVNEFLWKIKNPPQHVNYI